MKMKFVPVFVLIITMLATVSQAKSTTVIRSSEAIQHVKEWAIITGSVESINFKFGEYLLDIDGIFPEQEFTIVLKANPKIGLKNLRAKFLGKVVYAEGFIILDDANPKKAKSTIPDVSLIKTHAPKHAVAG